MRSISLKARAKINLGLDVLRKREDGYHEVKMVMQTINIYDKIYMKIIEKPEIKIVTNLSFLPTNESNLVYKAIQMLRDEFNIEKGVFANVYKYIPVAAGMAGGSTDAAAAMIGMNRLFKLGLSREELMERAVKIGADVPYCIMGGTALAEGIGEKLSQLKPLKRCSILVAKPDISVSTKFVYTNLKLDENTVHPDMDGVLEAIDSSDVETMAKKMSNLLESVTSVKYPQIEEIKKSMIELGAINSIMSGSGPTVFGIFGNRKEAKKAYKTIKEKGIAKRLFLTESFNK